MAKADLRIRVGAKDDTKKAFGSVRKNVRKLNKDVAKSGSGIKNIAGGFLLAQGVTAAASALKRFVADSFSAIDSQAKLAKRVGLTTEAFGSMAHAAELTGASEGQLAKGLEKMNKNLGDAIQGTGEAKKAFAGLGLDLGKLSKQDAASTFKDISEAIKNLDTQAERASFSAAIFGRGGQGELLNLIGTGRAGIEDMQREAVKLGLTFSGEGAAGVEEANDAMTRLKNSMKGAARILAINIAPTLARIVEGVTGKIQAVKALIQDFVPLSHAVAAEIALAITGAVDSAINAVVDAVNRLPAVLRDRLGVGTLGRVDTGAVTGLSALRDEAQAELAANTIARQAALASKIKAALARTEAGPADAIGAGSKGDKAATLAGGAAGGVASAVRSAFSALSGGGAVGRGTTGLSLIGGDASMRQQAEQARARAAEAARAQQSRVETIRLLGQLVRGQGGRGAVNIGF